MFLKGVGGVGVDKTFATINSKCDSEIQLMKAIFKNIKNRNRIFRICERDRHKTSE